MPFFWSESYINSKHPHGWPDALGYKVELIYNDGYLTERKYVSSWSDSAVHTLSTDLSEVYKTAIKIRNNARNNCQD